MDAAKRSAVFIYCFLYRPARDVLVAEAERQAKSSLYRPLRPTIVYDIRNCIHAAAVAPTPVGVAGQGNSEQKGGMLSV